MIVSLARCLIATLLAGTALAAPLLSDAGGAAAALAVEELAPGVYMHRGAQLPLDVPGHDDIANIGFIVGSRCVAVIDTGGSVRIGRALRAAVRRRTSLPICYVINTHVHVDHVLGNWAFKDDHPSFVGHAALAQAIVRSRPYFLKEYAQDLDVPAAPEQVIGPDRLVAAELTLDLGNRPLTLHAWPPAHPAIDRLAMQRPKLAVPGHGPATAHPGEVLARERAYLESLLQGVRRELAEG